MRTTILHFGLAAAVAASVLLAGCGNSSPVSGHGAGDGTGDATDATATSGWTSLGTRKTDSRANRPIPANADDRWSDYDPPAVYPKKLADANQYITMDDGIRLAATVAWPADADGVVPAQPLPVILTLTGYSKDNGTLVPILGSANPYFVEHGYIHVIVDTRGTGRSDGQWTAFSERDQQDYRQVVDWVVQQPWCDGHIGMYGASYLGITSELTAAKGHPAVKAAYVIAAPLGDAYRDVPVVGGEGSFGFLTIWMSVIGVLGTVNTSVYQDPAQFLQASLQHATGFLLNFQLPTLLRALAGDPETVYDTDFWAVRSPVEQAANIQVPVFIVSGLHDVFQRGAPRFYDALKDHTTAKLLMGPWAHGDTANGVGLPAGDIPVFDHTALMWFDRYVKGLDSGAERLPNVTQWVWGAERYVTNSDWPHPQARAQRLYLHGDKALSAALPAAGDAPRSIVQQPLNGLCSQSASQVSLGILGKVPLSCFTDDNVANALEVVYETAPMDQDFYIDGPIQADLWISTTAQDAGLTVRVSDVGPDGNAFNLANGLQMASQRAVDPAKSRYLDGQMIQVWHPFTQAAKQTVGSGNLVQVAVEVFPTSALIQQGYKLRVSVGASNFPYGLPTAPDLLASLTGVLSVHSDAEHPSSVVLPVVPASALR